MHTIAQIKTYPDKCAVDAVEAKLSRVFEHTVMDSKFKAGQKTSRQNVMLEDIAGNKIRMTVWGHPDLKEHEGKNYVFHAGRGGKGLAVKHGEYQGNKTVELAMSEAGLIQYVEVYRGQQGGAAAPAPEPAKGSNAASPGVLPVLPPSALKRQRNGQQVGMAINNAVQFMVNEGAAFNREEIKKRATVILDISDELEFVCPEAKPVEQMTTQEKKEANLEPDQKKGTNVDEDVPF